MKKLVVLAVASMIGASAMAGEVKWSGSAGWRYDQTKTDDSLEAKNNTSQAGISKTTTKGQSIRANLGATGGWEHMEWGVGLRTTGAGGANDDWARFGTTDNAFALEQAWMRYVRDFDPVDFSVTIGKQKPVFATDGTGNFLDADLRLVGLGWNFKFGMFGLNAGQYTTGAQSNSTTQGTSSYSYTDHTEKGPTTQTKFSTLFGFQPYMNWKFSDEIETTIAFGYYVWNDISNTNASSGGYASGNNAAASSKTAITALNYKIHNPKQWQVFNTWSLPYNLSASLEYVKNKKQVLNQMTVTGYALNAANPQPEVSSAAWTAGIAYGKIAKAHDFSVGYAYGSKGIGSVIDAYSNETFLPDNKGHTIMASYALADNFVLGWAGMFLSEKEKLDFSNGKAYGTSNSNNANQNQKTKYMELTASVMF